MTRQFLDMDILLREGDGDIVFSERPVDGLEEVVDFKAFGTGVIDPAEQFQVKGRGAEGTHPHSGLGILDHGGVLLGHGKQHRFYLFQIATIGNAHRNPYPEAGDGGAFVNDLAVGENGVGNGDQNVITGFDPGRAYPDLHHLSSMGVVDDDVVAHLEGFIGKDADPAEEIGKAVFGGQSHGDARDAGRGEKRGQVYVPDGKKPEQGGDDDDHPDDILEKQEEICPDFAMFKDILEEMLADHHEKTQDGNGPDYQGPHFSRPRAESGSMATPEPAAW